MPGSPHGFDEARRLRVVAQRLAQLAHEFGQPPLAHDPVGPDRIQQGFLGMEDADARRQVPQQGEGLGPQLNRA